MARGASLRAVGAQHLVEGCVHTSFAPLNGRSGLLDQLDLLLLFFGLLVLLLAVALTPRGRASGGLRLDRIN